MNLILFNIQWMSFNIALAIIPVVFGMLLIQVSSRLAKIIFGIVWFLFLPNTIYLVTDIMHFFADWQRVLPIDRPLFIFEYFVLMLCGIVTFVLGLLPIDKLLQSAKNRTKKRQYEWSAYLFNFLIGFGIVLGRIERINSWDVLTNTSKVIYKSVHTLTSFNQLLLVIFFGLFCNLVYFSCKDFLAKKFTS